MKIKQAALGCDRHLCGFFSALKFHGKFLGDVGRALCGEVFPRELISLKFSTNYYCKFDYMTPDVLQRSRSKSQRSQRNVTSAVVVISSKNVVS